MIDLKLFVLGACIGLQVFGSQEVVDPCQMTGFNAGIQSFWYIDKYRYAQFNFGNILVGYFNSLGNANTTYSCEGAMLKRVDDAPAGFQPATKYYINITDETEGQPTRHRCLLLSDLPQGQMILHFAEANDSLGLNCSELIEAENPLKADYEIWYPLDTVNAKLNDSDLFEIDLSREDLWSQLGLNVSNADSWPLSGNELQKHWTLKRESKECPFNLTGQSFKLIHGPNGDCKEDSSSMITFLDNTTVSIDACNVSHSAALIPLHVNATCVTSFAASDVGAEGSDAWVVFQVEYLFSTSNANVTTYEYFTARFGIVSSNLGLNQYTGMHKLQIDARTWYGIPAGMTLGYDADRHNAVEDGLPVYDQYAANPYVMRPTWNLFFAEDQPEPTSTAPLTTTESATTAPLTTTESATTSTRETTTSDSPSTNGLTTTTDSQSDSATSETTSATNAPTEMSSKQTSEIPVSSTTSVNTPTSIPTSSAVPDISTTKWLDTMTTTASIAESELESSISSTKSSDSNSNTESEITSTTTSLLAMANTESENFYTNADTKTKLQFTTPEWIDCSQLQSSFCQNSCKSWTSSLKLFSVCVIVSIARVLQT